MISLDGLNKSCRKTNCSNLSYPDFDQAILPLIPAKGHCADSLSGRYSDNHAPIEISIGFPLVGTSQYWLLFAGVPSVLSSLSVLKLIIYDSSVSGERR